MKSPSETTNDEPIRNRMTTPLPFSFVHVHWYKLYRRKKCSVGGLKRPVVLIQAL